MHMHDQVPAMPGPTPMVVQVAKACLDDIEILTEEWIDVVRPVRSSLWRSGRGNRASLRRRTDGGRG